MYDDPAISCLENVLQESNSIEEIKFYSNTTINSMWNQIDVLLTSNPDLLLNHPTDKVVIKFVTDYNKEINSKYEITSLKELKNKLKEIENYDV